MVVDYSRDVLEHMTVSLGGNVNIENIAWAELKKINRTWYAILGWRVARSPRIGVRMQVHRHQVNINYKFSQQTYKQHMCIHHKVCV